MTINSINGVNTQAGQLGMNQAADSYSRNIQSQIANAQKQLQELSSNEDLTAEEKMKKRQEVQQQISDLNMQLRQHRLEQRREKQQEKGSSAADRSGGSGNAKSGSKAAGLSQASMTALISADNSIKQARVQGSVATRMEGKARVLESEIKQDAGGGTGVEKKREELADVERKAQASSSSQLSTLADANRTMEEAAKADSRDQKAGDAKEKASEEKLFGADTQGENASDAGGVNTQSGTPASGSSTSADEATAAPQRPKAYTPVDIRL